MNTFKPSAIFLGLCIAVSASAQHPVATDTYHGVVVRDPYRWLEDAKALDVKAWVADQNASTRKYLDGLQSRPAIAAVLHQIESTTSTYDESIQQAGGKLFALTYHPGAEQPQLTQLALSGDPASRKVVFDPNTHAAHGSMAIDWFVPSPNGKLVAASLSLNGSEDGTLHVFDADNGHEVEKPIPHVQYPTAGGSLAWNADSTGFWYTRFPDDSAPESERHFNQQAYYHELGKGTADKLVLSTADGLPRTAEIYLDNRYANSSALASVQLGDGGQWQHFLVSTKGAKRIAGYDDNIKAAALAQDGTVFGISFKNALNGKLVKMQPPYHTITTIVPEMDTALLIEAHSRSIAISGNRIFVTLIDGGPTLLESFDFDGKSQTRIATPANSTVRELESMPNGNLLYQVRSYLVPPHYLVWHASSSRSEPTPLRQQSPMDLSGFHVRRVFATSRDGTRVPISVITRKGFVADGSAPLLLYGYGGYGVSLTPRFISSEWFLFLRAGGSVAVANLRGGGEYGERWHQQGMLTHKQNVFDDFTAAARYLVAKKYTRSSRLAIEGGSNGGLLMGAVLTQHPKLAHAVVSVVGIYDMLRVEVDPNGSFNTTEFGSVKNLQQFRALLAYSPLQHVTAGQYPAILLATGDNDGRVNPMQSRKFTAALQASGTKQPVYLRTSAAAGHGIGSSTDETISLHTDITAFLLDQLHMDWRAATEAR